jgi:hypothetical protein
MAIDFVQQTTSRLVEGLLSLAVPILGTARCYFAQGLPEYGHLKPRVTVPLGLLPFWFLVVPRSQTHARHPRAIPRKQPGTGMG